MSPNTTPGLLNNNAGQRLSIDTAESQRMSQRSGRESGRLVRQA